MFVVLRAPGFFGVERRGRLNGIAPLTRLSPSGRGDSGYPGQSGRRRRKRPYPIRRRGCLYSVSVHSDGTVYVFAWTENLWRLPDFSGAATLLADQISYVSVNSSSFVRCSTLARNGSV